MKKILNLFLLTYLFVSLTASMALAAGTTAGTDINNTATVAYTVDGVDLTKDSPTVTFTVAEILDATLISLDAATILVKPNDTGAPTMLTFQLDNTGNYEENFLLTADNTAVTTDNFDPDSPATIYVSTNNTYEPGTDLEYDSANPPTIAADGTIYLFVFSDIPAAPLDTHEGTTRLTVDAETGTGPAGTVYAGAGFDGLSGIAAVVGTSTASVSADGTYRISRVDVTIGKTGVVTNDNLGLGGTEPVPGATVQYTVTVNVTGGTANALTIKDPVPAEVTYDNGTLTLDTAAQTEASDSPTDESEVVEVTPGNFEINVDLGDVTGGATPGTTHIITFDATIK